MVVLWHVIDLKVSHIDRFEINKFSKYLSSIYVGIIVNNVKVKDCLVIDLNYIKQGTVNASIIKYLDSELQDLP